MKFGENLKLNLTHEWRKQYIDYEKLKEIIERYEGVSQIRNLENTNSKVSRKLSTIGDGSVSAVKRRKSVGKGLQTEFILSQMSDMGIRKLFDQCSDEFFLAVEDELEKVNLFFCENISRMTRTYKEIESTWSVIKFDSEDRDKKKAIADMKFAVSETYLMMKKIEVFQTLNHTGFRKICKKHDKILARDTGKIFMADVIDQAAFWTDKNLKRRINGLEEMMAGLEGGDMKKAMERLRVPPMREHIQNDSNMNSILIFLGIQIGTIIISFVIFGLMIAYGDLNLDYPTSINLFRPTLFIWVFLLLFSINMYGWSQGGVNNVLIFGLNPRDRLTYWHIALVATTLGVAWCSGLLTYLIISSRYLTQTNFPIYILPIVLNVALFSFFMIRVNIFDLNSTRIWLQRVMAKEFLSGFVPVCFVDFWFADQLNSLALVFLDIEFFFCFYIKEQTLEVEDDLDFNSNDLDFSVLGNNTPLPNETITTVDENDGFQCGTFDYGVRYFVAVLPAYFRLAQCFRRANDSQKEANKYSEYSKEYKKYADKRNHHLANAGKYSTAFIKVLCSAVYSKYKHKVSLAFWFISHTVSAIYTLYWDLINDWGLLKPSTKNFLLRDELIYGHGLHNWIYYLAMVEDTILRFAWLAHYFLKTSVWKSEVGHALLTTAFGFLEIFRRFVWNFFRLENEHLNNCGEFRAVRDISIAPLEENDLSRLESLMDSNIEDKLINRKPVKSNFKFQQAIRNSRILLK